MPESALYSEEYLPESGQEDNKLLLRVVELERELMKVRRTEKVLHEMELRYLALMDSALFLHFILTPGGTFRMMNHHAEVFFGFQLKFGMELTLQSLSGPGYTGEVESLLLDAVHKPTHVTLPVIRAEGTLGWLDMELSYSTYQGEPSIQVIAADITDLTKGKTEGSLLPPPAASRPETNPSYALQVLNSCPGLLCFAVDRNGTLLYSTRGYREVAKRFLGHECTCGFPYPVNLDSAFDMELHEQIHEAYLGNTNMTSLIEKGEEGDNQWNVTTAPLASAQGNIVGAVVHLTSLVKNADRPFGSASLPQSNTDFSMGEVKALQDFIEKFEFSQSELLNSIQRMSLVLDSEGRCAEVNSYFLNTLTLERENVIGRKFMELAMENEPSNVQLSEKISRLVKNDLSEEVECKLCTQDGEILSLGLKGAPVQWGVDMMTLLSCTDNSKLRRTEEQLKRMSTTDASTGTLNRHGMERVLTTEIERAVRYRGSLSLIMLDIDCFRNMNERIGYAASDRVLKELSTALKARIRSTDFLGRWGGDEFMILTPSQITATYQLAEKLRDMVQHNTFGADNKLTISAGIAEFRKNMNISTFVACAYDAMTEAKRGGGNRSVQALQQEPEEQATEPSKSTGGNIN